MTRHILIREIFDRIPRTYKGFNRNGEHIVQITHQHTAMYATLEKLSDHDLQSLAGTMKVCEPAAAIEA